MKNRNTRWQVQRTNSEYLSYIAGAASVSLPFAQVLVNRGMKTPSEIGAFLCPDISLLSDPLKLDGMDKAVHRLTEARKQKEKVLVHGDYDADGLTATAIMVEGLRRFGIEPSYFIPHRVRDGYGFGQAGLDYAVSAGAALIVTVDCGITSFETIAQAGKLGIDVIVTDHHEPEREENSFSDSETPAYRIPGAVAVVNPKAGKSGAGSNLSGAGIAFQCVHALLGGSDGIADLTDLAAIGTAADVVPVLGDNRMIVAEGLRRIHEGGRAGIASLKSISGVKNGPIRSSHLHYSLIPRINAAGRMDSASDVIELLLTPFSERAETLASWLNDLNRSRQETEAQVLREALGKMSAREIPGAVVLASEGWHPGVLGIVASRVADQFHRPAFILTIENGIVSGSARSIPSFDIHTAIVCCRDLLIRYGGHRQAAGLSLPLEHLDLFRERMNSIVSATLTPDDFITTLSLDAEIPLSAVTGGFMAEITRLEPYGYGNEEPLFGVRNVKMLDARVVGNNHLKAVLTQNGRRMDAVGFDLGNLLPLAQCESVDAAFVPSYNDWNGSRYLQAQIRALRPGQSR